MYIYICIYIYIYIYDRSLLTHSTECQYPRKMCLKYPDFPGRSLPGTHRFSRWVFSRELMCRRDVSLGNIQVSFDVLAYPIVCRLLQCVAVCCRVLQYAAVCGSALQGVNFITQQLHIQKSAYYQIYHVKWVVENVTNLLHANNSFDIVSSLRHAARLVSSLSITLQQTATHCNTLQHTATHCNTLQQTAANCNTLQHTATHCSKLQHSCTSCLQSVYPSHMALTHTATHCNTWHSHTLQHTTTHGTHTHKYQKTCRGTAMSLSHLTHWVICYTSMTHLTCTIYKST